MKLPPWLSLAASSTTIVVLPALAAAALDFPSANVVQLAFQKLQLPPELIQITRQRLRRDILSLASINNITGGGYYSEIEVGTPPQKMQVMLDTGSSDTWVVSREADLCNSRSLQRMYGGCGPTYDASKSSTYSVVTANGFDITYLDGRRIRGDYVADSLTIESKSVKAQQIGLAVNTLRGTGLLGLGMPENEATPRKYPTVLDSMLAQGLIARRAFSLYLNDLQSSMGTVLFGGVDTEKYIGTLKTLPLVRDFASRNFTSYSVGLRGVSIANPDGSRTPVAPFPPATAFDGSAILDSGSTLSLLPAPLTLKVWEKLGVLPYAFDAPNSSYGLVDCALGRGSSGSATWLDFDFAGGATIRVPLEEMVLDNLRGVADQLRAVVPFKEVCLFGIQSSAAFGINDVDFALLGDTFLRSAYVVYDIQGMQVGMAQANLNSTRSNVIALRAEDAALPTATGVKSQEPYAPPAPTPTPAGASGGGTGTGAGAGGASQETVTVTAGAGGTTPSGAARPGQSAAGRIGGDRLGLLTLVGALSSLGAALLIA